MTFKDRMQAIAEQMKQTEMADSGVLTLGELIAKLENCQSKDIVKIDFTENNPLGLDSYRGYYSDLAIEYIHDKIKYEITVAEFLVKCKECVGKTFLGYKGGNYRMNNRTIMWVSPYSQALGKMVVGLKSRGGVVTIITADED